MTDLTRFREWLEVWGNQIALARWLGVKHQAIRNWVLRGRVPRDRVPKVAKFTGIPRHQLNADAYSEKGRAL